MELATPEIRALLFDLDGTIVDTEPAAARAIHESFLERGIALSEIDSQYTTGRTWDSALQYLFKTYPVDFTIEDAKKDIMVRYRSSLKKSLRVIPGVIGAIRTLAEIYPLALVSGSDREDIDWVLDRLLIRDHFKIILGAQDYSLSKPSPDGYLKALEGLGHPGEATLVFEDSQAGIAAARAAKAWVVAITAANHHDQDISESHRHIPDFTRVTPDWVTEISQSFISLD